jgi:hypothetical protein
VLVLLKGLVALKGEEEGEVGVSPAIDEAPDDVLTSPPTSSNSSNKSEDKIPIFFIIGNICLFTISFQI